MRRSRVLSLVTVWALLAPMLAVLTVGAGVAPVAAAPLSGPSRYVPLRPDRVLDTRIGMSASGPVAPGGQITIPLLGRGGVPSSGAVAVLLNVTVTDATGPGYVQVFPTNGASIGDSSNINVEHAGQTIPNLVVAPLGSGGQVTIFTQGGGHILADVFGYFERTDTASAGRYLPVFPNRLLDTRMQAPGKLAAGATVRVPISGRSGVPAGGVSAVVLNVTATEASAEGYVQVLPTGDGTIGAFSNLNLAEGQTIPNLVVVPVGGDGSITLFSQSGTHLVVDVFGYFTNLSAPVSSEGLFVPISPSRLADTRRGLAPSPGAIVSVAPRGVGGIPASGVAAVFGNLTATESAAAGYLQVVPGPASAAPVGYWSNANVERSGQTIPNAAIANLGTDGTLLLYTSNGAHMVFDAAGYFTGVDTGNHWPTVPPLTFSVAAGASIDVDMRNYARDADGDPLRIVTMSSPGDGALSLLDATTFRYHASGGASRQIGFTVTVADNRGGSATSNVTIYVVGAEANQWPTASPVERAVTVGGFVDIDLVAAATDADGDLLRIVSFSQPGQGGVQQLDNRAVRYFAPGSPTDIAFTYTVTDDRGGVASNTVVVHVVSSGPPMAPSGLTLTTVSWSNPTRTLEGSVGTHQLRWINHDGNAQGLRVYVTSNLSTGSQLLATLAPGTTSTTVTVPGFSVRYGVMTLRVASFNGAGESSSAGVVVNAPIPNAPQVLSYTRVSPTQVQVRWTHDPVLGFQTHRFVLRTTTDNICCWLRSLGELDFSVEAGGSSPQTVQLEDASLLPAGSAPLAMTANGGFTGAGYVGTWGSAGQTVRFSVYAPSAGSQTVTMRYRQAGSDAPSTREVRVNGVAAGSVAFARNAAEWSQASWSEVTTSVPLAAGWNTIDLVHPGPANANWLDLDRAVVNVAAPLGSSTQAETATLLPVGGAPPTSVENGGYLGSGYVGLWGTAGQSVRFTVTAPASGAQTVTLRYRQADSDVASTRQLRVNGADAGQVAFARSALAWADPNGWRDVSINVNLTAGTNTIELVHPGPTNANWLDLDQLSVGNARPVYVATMQIPAGQEAQFSCVTVMATHPVAWPYGSSWSTDSPAICLP